MRIETMAVRSIAEELPEGSIVATGAKALFKGEAIARPWLSTAGGSAANHEVDTLLSRGAEIMRRGRRSVILQTGNAKSSLHGSPTLDKLINSINEVPSPVEYVDDLISEMSEPTDDKQIIKQWVMARYNDESHLTEIDMLTKTPTCSIKAPHNAHKWGEPRRFKCKGLGNDPNNLSFGALVYTVTTTGAVEHWVMMQDESNRFPWRSPDGRTHGHKFVVDGVTSGLFTIVRWGV